MSFRRAIANTLTFGLFICWGLGKSSAFSAPSPKKILLSFDGTGNNARDFEPDPHTDRFYTNVLRLHLLAGGDINNKRNDVDGQICLYERGIGAKSDSSIVRTLRQIGGDLRRETKPMRKKLEAVYEKGDELYMIGFSRGAAAARKFAVELHEDGLKTKDGEKVEDPPIEFLGCFETVSMQVKNNFFEILRTSRKREFTKSTVVGEDGKVAPNVKKAVHNVAMDDNRQFYPPPQFPPVLMGAEDRVHEAWFAGEHGDVGGNFFTKGIPDCSCLYMKEWMESAGLKFIEAKDINKNCLKIDDYPEVTNIPEPAELALTPDPSDKIHLNQDSQVKTDDNEPSYRLVHVLKNDEIVPEATVYVHESYLLHQEAWIKKGTPNDINPNLKKVSKFVKVVETLGRVSRSKTERLRALLEGSD